MKKHSQHFFVTMQEILLMVILLWSSQVQAQLSPQWEKLESLRQKIVSTPSKSDELAYLASFPRTFHEFTDVFGGYRTDRMELADVVQEHLDILMQLAKKYPEKIEDIEIRIAVGGHWDADAVGGLQKQMVNLAATDTKSFSKKLLQRSRAERASVIRFMADVENHVAYYEYGEVISNLRRLEMAWLAEEFELAREVRNLEGHW